MPDELIYFLFFGTPVVFVLLTLVSLVSLVISLVRLKKNPKAQTKALAITSGVFLAIFGLGALLTVAGVVGIVGLLYMAVAYM